MILPRNFLTEPPEVDFAGETEYAVPFASASLGFVLLDVVEIASFALLALPPLPLASLVCCCSVLFVVRQLPLALPSLLTPNPLLLRNASASRTDPELLVVTGEFLLPCDDDSVSGVEICEPAWVSTSIFRLSKSGLPIRNIFLCNDFNSVSNLFERVNVTQQRSPKKWKKAAISDIFYTLNVDWIVCFCKVKNEYWSNLFTKKMCETKFI